MREVIVAAFETQARTHETVRGLVSAGIDSSAIRSYRKDDPGVAGRYETKQGFWSWLTGSGGKHVESVAEYVRDYPAYTRAIAAGRTVVAVNVDESQRDVAADELAKRWPLDLAESDTVPPGAVAQPVAAQRTITQLTAPGATAPAAIRVHHYAVDTPIRH